MPSQLKSLTLYDIDMWLFSPILCYKAFSKQCLMFGGSVTGC